jgi:hypothetical protein
MVSKPMYSQRQWDDIVEGEDLPTLHDHLDVERVVATSASTWTFFGGHIDADYARNVQGRNHVYLATGPVLGLVDSYVTGWLGPESFLAKRKLRMVDSLYAGNDIVFTGIVRRKWIDHERGYPRSLVEIDAAIENGSGKPCVVATATYELPSPKANVATARRSGSGSAIND